MRAILTLPFGAKNAEAICFLGNELYVRIDGRTCVRTLKHTGWNPADGFITPPSQGQG